MKKNNIQMPAFPLHPSATYLEPIELGTSGLKILNQQENKELTAYFEYLLQNKKRAEELSILVTSELSKEELICFLQRTNIKEGNDKIVKPFLYDKVIPEVVTKLEDFIKLIMVKNISDIKYLEKSHKEVFQELREAFATKKILKKRLRHYFQALYGIDLSAKTMIAQLKIIEPTLFSDETLINRKKDTASYRF